jgi:hypothetical protein
MAALVLYAYSIKMKEQNKIVTNISYYQYGIQIKNNIKITLNFVRFEVSTAVTMMISSSGR